MAKTLYMAVKYEGSEAARKRFLWDLVYDEDDIDEIKEGEPQGPEDFDSMEELVNHAREHAWGERPSGRGVRFHHIPITGIDDVSFDVFTDGMIAFEAEDEDHYSLLQEIASEGHECAPSETGITVTISLDGEEVCGRECFKFQNEKLIEQWFVNDRHDSGLWSPCRISWNGPAKAVKSFLEDITAETKGDDEENLYERSEQHWIGKRLNLDEYYDETGPYMRCAICDGTIEKDHISFDAYCDDFDEKEPITEMFDAIAAAHPALSFEMQVCSINNDEFEWVKFRIYKDGECTEERVSEDPEDKFDFAQREIYHRYSLSSTPKRARKGA